METKICNQCGREFPLEDFYRNPYGRDGRRGTCKHCYIEQQAQRTITDPQHQVKHRVVMHEVKRVKDMTPEEKREHNREYHRHYREEHRDRVRQISRESIARARAGKPKRKSGPAKGAQFNVTPKPTRPIIRKRPVKVDRSCMRCVHYPCFDGIENFVTDFAQEGCHGYKEKGQAI